MTGISWTALGTVSTKVAAQSSALPDILMYSIEAIAVCAIVAAVVVFADIHREQVVTPIDDENCDDEIAMLRRLAETTLFAESHLRLLSALRHLERTDGDGRPRARRASHHRRPHRVDDERR